MAEKKQGKPREGEKTRRAMQKSQTKANPVPKPAEKNEANAPATPKPVAANTQGQATARAKRKAPAITADTPIMELVMNHPKAVSVLMDYGFHCIGCQLSAYESLGQGAAAHGMDEAQIKKMVSEINAIIEG